MDGYTIMGAIAAGGPAVVVRLLDVRALVEREGGGAGSLAMMVAPGTIEAKVYDKVREELASALSSKGVLAEVSVVDQAPRGPRPKTDITTGIALGAGAVGILWLGKSLVWPWLRQLGGH